MLEGILMGEIRFSRDDSLQARETKLNALQQQVGQAAVSVIPVGGIFLSAENINPAFLLGYGTWELIGSGHLFL